jgi:tetratricopeptide (TPR) repeat protein
MYVPKAIQDFTKAIELNPDEKIFYYKRGLSYQKSDRKDDCAKDFAKFNQLKK